MKIAMVQINPIVGDLEGNVMRCVQAAREATERGADLIALPEMVVPGYPPRDILYDASFVEATLAAADDLAERLAGLPPTLFGAFQQIDLGRPHHPGLLNTAFLAHEGKLRVAAEKRLLPVYDVFYEPRWFEIGTYRPPLAIAGQQVGVLVCEDLWDEDYIVHPPAELIAAGAEMLICLAASPYRAGAQVERLYHARRQGVPVLHINMVGANDELIFDGQSFAINAEGAIIGQAAAFTTDITLVDMDEAQPLDVTPPDISAERTQALTLGIRDFAAKNRLAKAVVGLSGGIDSAVTAVLAVQALGADAVMAVTIPSRYTNRRSTEAAHELASNLGIRCEVVELEGVHQAAEASLPALEGTAAENIQARLRAMILMGFVNQQGGFLLNTSNKTEMALGYATLYGDMAGALCPIADLTKPQVRALALWLNEHIVTIPPFILERPPSAELKPDQVDPFDYPTLAPQLEGFVQRNQSNHALRRSEHKRWQAGVILKVSPKAFGTGRLMPITRR